MRPRHIPFGMMGIGCIGFIVFDHLSRLSADSFGSGYRDELIALGFGYFGAAGFILGVISNIWILAAVIAFLLRRKHPKQT
jgi:hypothetical protein